MHSTLHLLARLRGGGEIDDATLGFDSGGRISQKIIWDTLLIAAYGSSRVTRLHISPMPLPGKEAEEGVEDARTVTVKGCAERGIDVQARFQTGVSM